jgi:hypothetical protein
MKSYNIFIIHVKEFDMHRKQVTSNTLEITAGSDSTDENQTA